MIYHVRRVFFCGYHALKNLIYHDGIEHAGYMSFIVLLAIFPFIIFILAFCGFLGASEVGREFISFLLTHFPNADFNLINARINELLTLESFNILNLAGIGIIWTISSFVECLRTIFNRIYCIKNYPSYFFRRLLSIVQFLFIAIIFILIMLFFVLVPIVVKNIPTLYLIIEKHTGLFFYFRYFALFLSLFLIMSFIYYVVPNNKMQILNVIPGSIITVLLWTVSGKILFKYISYYKQLSVVYGSLGSIIVTMMFFYIVNIIIIYGAEFNYLVCNKK